VPKENVHISKFTVGEFSAAGLARVDLEITPLAAEIQENIFPQSVGSGIVRPGTQYLGTTASSVIRLMPFVRSVDDVAMLELSDGMLRVWVDDAPVSRAKVDCQVTNTRFDYDGGWTKSTTSGSYITIAGNLMTLEARARGSECWTQQTISTSSVNVEQARFACASDIRLVVNNTSRKHLSIGACILWPLHLRSAHSTCASRRACSARQSYLRSRLRPKGRWR